MCCNLTPTTHCHFVFCPEPIHTIKIQHIQQSVLPNRLISIALQWGSMSLQMLRSEVMWLWWLSAMACLREHMCVPIWTQKTLHMRLMGQGLHTHVLMNSQTHWLPPTHETWTYSHPDRSSIYYTVSLTLKVFIVDKIDWCKWRENLRETQNFFTLMHMRGSLWTPMTLYHHNHGSCPTTRGELCHRCKSMTFDWWQTILFHIALHHARTHSPRLISTSGHGSSMMQCYMGKGWSVINQRSWIASVAQLTSCCWAWTHGLWWYRVIGVHRLSSHMHKCEEVLSLS